MDAVQLWFLMIVHKLTLPHILRGYVSVPYCKTYKITFVFLYKNKQIHNHPHDEVVDSYKFVKTLLHI